jgi:WD40 repeat protein
MAQTSRTFRIFVSSTFSDLKAERNALQEKVFPRLRDLAVGHGCRFQAIDLRWGVSEEAALDQQTMKICLGEIERCQKTSPRPNFIVLLGNRYGWHPLPYEIPADEFEKILTLISKEDKDLLERWYSRDDNADPVVYILQSRAGEFVEYEHWEKVEIKLRQVLLPAIEALSFSQDALLKYTASATEQEIVAGALQVPDASEHVFCFLRDIEGLPDDNSAASFREIDLNAAQKQAKLKERLKQQLPHNIHEYTVQWQGDGPSLDHLDQLCEDVYAELSKVILAEAGKLETVDPLEKEISAHEVFGKDRARVFIGRADLLKAIGDYIIGSDPHPLAIWGVSGSGKSALMAKAVENAQKSGKDVIYRFVGATPESSNGRSLLESLCKQISRPYGADESTIPSEYKDLLQEFPKRLALAKPEKPLILFLDALDQLSDTDNARNLVWLSAELPPNVRLIISTLPGECLKALEGKVPGQNRLEVHSMSVEDGKAILIVWFGGVRRKLQDQQEQYLLGKFKDCGLPLYLKLAFEEARLWKSYDVLPELSGDIPAILRDLFKRLSQESNHGEMLVSRSLGYLAAAKNGLSEDELLDVLSRDGEVLANFQCRSPKSPKVEYLPVVVWSRLYFDLEPYLTERSADGTSLLGFYHRQMSEAVNVGYLSSKDRSRRHQTLAEYFCGQSLVTERFDKKIPNLRKLSEQPYQQTYGGMRTELVKTLSDYWFMETKIIVDSIQALIEDYNRARSTEYLQLQEGDQEAMRLIQGVLHLTSGILHDNPHELAGQLHGRLQNSENSIIGALLAQAATKRDKPWLRPLLGNLEEPDKGTDLVLTGHTDSLRFVILTHDGRHIVSWSQDRSLKVWNIDNGEEEFLLEKGNLLLELEVTPDDQFAVALDHNHELKVWNIHTGRLENTLWTCERPFLLTPDSKHVVINHTPQRNRIGNFELKLMNIITGNEECSFGKEISESSNLAITPDGESIAISVGPAFGQKLMIFDLLMGKQKGIFECQAFILKITVTADGKYFVIETRKMNGKHEFRVVDSIFMKEQFTIESSSDSQLYAGQTGLYHLSWERFKAKGKTKGMIKNLSTGEERVFECDEIINNLSGSLLLSPDGNFLAGDEGTQKSRFGVSISSCMLDLNTGHIVVKIGILKCWGFIRDGKKVILESTSHNLVIADLGKLMLENHTTGFKQSRQLKLVAVTPDDQYAIIVAENIKVWNLISRQEEFALEDPAYRMILSPEGKRIITDYPSVIDLNTKSQFYLTGLNTMNYNYSIDGMLIAADGNHLVAWAKQNFTSKPITTCKVWNLQTRSVEQTLEFEDAWSCAISPSCRRIACRTGDGHTVSVWDIASGREERVIQDSGSGFEALAFTHSGDRLLIAGNEAGNTCHLYIYELEGNGNEIMILEAKYLKPMRAEHQSSQEILLDTIDEMWVVTRSSQNELMVWNLAKRRLEHQMAGHCASLSLNQQHFAFASGSQIGIYDFERAEIVVTFHIDHEVTGVLLTKDGKTLIAGDQASNVHLLQLEAGI